MPQELPPAPSAIDQETPKRTATPSFWTMVTISTAATIADLETTAAAMRNPMCREVNPIMGRNPSRARLYATGLGVHTGLTLLTYWIKKKGVGAWWIPHAASSGLHGYAAVHNARSGCF